MSTPLKDIRNREPVDLTPGVTTTLRFDGVEVTETATGRVVLVAGTVDLGKYGTVMYSGTSPVSGQPWTRDGVGLHAYLMDGQPVDRFYRAVGVRFLENMKRDLETGAYMTTEYVITPVGDPPTTKYQVERRPLVPSIPPPSPTPP
jgi:hypothetical protein